MFAFRRFSDAGEPLCILCMADRVELTNTSELTDCFTVILLASRMGYHQLMLHPASRAIATFSTPWGNIRPERLILGAKSSQDAFHEVIYRIFGDIDGCLNQSEDILICAKTQEEHDKILEKVLQKLLTMESLSVQRSANLVQKKLTSMATSSVETG